MLGILEGEELGDPVGPNEGLKLGAMDGGTDATGDSSIGGNCVGGPRPSTNVGPVGGTDDSDPSKESHPHFWNVMPKSIISETPE